MKTYSAIIWATMCAITLPGCSEHIDYDSPEIEESNRANEYTVAWVKTIGKIPADQDWCMLTTANISISSAGGTTDIYNVDPAVGGHLKGIAKGDGQLMVDITKGTQRLYAVMSDADGEAVAEGYFSVADGEATVSTAALEPARKSRYAHDAEGGSYFDAMVVCEDLGSIGDFDFNDIVFGLRRIAGTNQLQITPMAAGGVFEAHVYFRGSEVGEIHDMVLKGTQPGTFVNAYEFNGAGRVITLDVPSGWTIASGWSAKDLSLRIVDTGEAYDIRTPDLGKAPQMMCLGGDFFWPVEMTSIKVSYPDFTAWATGNYTDSETTWIDNKVVAKVVPWDINSCRSWFVGTTTDGQPYTFKGNTGKTNTVASGEVFYVDDPTDCKDWFSIKSSIQTLDLNGSHFNTSSITNINMMFFKCSGLTSLDVSGWDVSKVTDMTQMFYDCRRLTSLDVSGWDVSNVRDMSNMFNGCSGLASLDLSGWDVSKVTNMRSLFYYCSGLTSLDLSGWDVSKVTNMRSLFSYCSGLTSLDLSAWDVSKVKDMSYMFYVCSGLANLDVSGWDVSNVTSMDQMFYCCRGLTSLNVSSWDVSNVTDMGGAFFGCSGLTNLDVSGWDVSKVTNVEHTFSGCRSLTSLDLSGWDMSKVTSMDQTFYCCRGLTSLDVSGWDVSNVTNMQYTFYNCSALTSLDVSGWDVSNVTNMNSMFSGCSALTSLDVSAWDVSNVTNMQFTFQDCSSLTSLDVSGWDVSNVTNMGLMFYDCPSTLTIKCTAAFRDWCIDNASTINLPSGLRSTTSSQWIIVD